MRREDTLLGPTSEDALPSGPPLHLERRGQVTRLLSPFLLPERLERLERIVAARTRHVTLLLEQVHDAHNIAACIRTCDAFALQDIHLIPPVDKPLRMSRLVSSGADRWVTVHVHPDLSTALEAIRARGYRLAVTDAQQGVQLETPTSVPLKTPLCVAFGNERDGISEALREEADLNLHIPMVGFVESLNISVAVAITVSRLRERLNASEETSWRLNDEARERLLDRWVLEDVPRARAVLEEIARRHERVLSAEDGSA